MSKAQNQVSLIDFMRSYVEKASTGYVSDLERTPVDKLEEIPDSPKKAEIDFIADCTEENMEITHILRGEGYSSPCYPGMKTEHHSATEISQLTADLMASTNDLLAAMEAMGDDGLSNPVVSPEGETLPAYRLATRAANHMKYHDLYTGVIRPV